MYQSILDIVYTLGWLAYTLRSRDDYYFTFLGLTTSAILFIFCMKPWIDINLQFLKGLDDTRTQTNVHKNKRMPKIHLSEASNEQYLQPLFLYPFKRGSIFHFSNVFAKGVLTGFQYLPYG